jgi:hypothetical protein
MEAYSQNCMIANAVCEILPDAKVIYLETKGVVKGAVIKIQRDDRLFMITLSKEVYRKMQDFDVGFTLAGLETAKELREHIQPFSFEITIPKALIDCIGDTRLYKILSESKTLCHADPFETI